MVANIFNKCRIYPLLMMDAAEIEDVPLVRVKSQHKLLYIIERKHLSSARPKEKSFSCIYCKYSCKASSSLKNHLLVHSNEKPFQCLECDYKSKTKGHLKRHSLIHSENKPFQCSQCDYTCRSKCHLKSHLLTHSKEKPF